MTDAIDPLDLRTFPPVTPLSTVPGRWRQTFIAKHTECPRSAYLYLKYNGGALTPPLAGGTLLHRALERFIRNLWENNETQGTPEDAKDILNEVLVESTDLTVSPDRLDSLRAMMHHVAEGFVIDPEKVTFIETPVECEINGRTLSGTIDFGELDPGRLLALQDFKSAFFNVLMRPAEQDDDEEYVPTKEEWPGTFQLVLYAYMAATGPHKIDVPEYRLRQVHPRQFWESEGTVAYREATIDRETLLDWRFYLEAEVAKLEQAFSDWQFPAILGSHCTFCPASAECPIPAPLRNYRGEIRTLEDAQRAAVIWERHGNIRTELWNAIKGFAEVTGQRIPYGRDLELMWRKREEEKVKPKVEVPGGKKIKGRIALRDAIARTEDIGVPLDWSYFHTKSVSTRLTRRKLTPAELNDREQQKGSTE